MPLRTQRQRRVSARRLGGTAKWLALSYSGGEGASFSAPGEVFLRSFPFLTLPPCHWPAISAGWHSVTANYSIPKALLLAVSKRRGELCSAVNSLQRLQRTLRRHQLRAACSSARLSPQSGADGRCPLTQDRPASPGGCSQPTWAAHHTEHRRPAGAAWCFSLRCHPIKH